MGESREPASAIALFGWRDSGSANPKVIQRRNNALFRVAHSGVQSRIALLSKWRVSVSNASQPGGAHASGDWRYRWPELQAKRVEMIDIGARTYGLTTASWLMTIVEPRPQRSSRISRRS